MRALSVFVLSVMSLSAKANVEALAQELFESASKFPANPADVQKSLSEKMPQSSKLESKELQDVSKLFDEEFDTGQREGDSIRSNLSLKVNEHNKAHQHKTGSIPSISEVEGLLNQKHHYQFSETDSVFLGHKNVQADNAQKVDNISNKVNAQFDANLSQRASQTDKETEEKIVSCREAGLTTLEPCTKRLVLRVVSQEPLVKTVTAYFTARCWNEVTFGINLKTGKINVSYCQNPGPQNLSVDNPIGEPDYPERTTVELISSQHIGDNDITFEANLKPSYANGFSGSLTALRAYYGILHDDLLDESNKNRVKGGRYVWKITMPRKPKLVAEWQGCEDLERKTEEGVCTLGQSILTGVQESRKIEGYPDLVKQDFWAEERSYACGFGSDKNECESLVQQGCEQIGSKCAIQKGEHCIEYEKTFSCAPNGFQDSLKTGNPDVFDFNLEKNKIQLGFEGYSTNDFGIAMTHFNALKEMSHEMKDGLGSISGDPNNPTIFHGKCDRCTIKGGRWIQDCCNLKGVLQGVLGGGCRESEKLATAVFREKRCHLVQKKYCTHKLKLGIAKICVEWKDAYCCYGSELARIIQEIAHDDSAQSALRSYNASHGIDSGWGSGENPNCRSLSAEQLSLINFDTAFAQRHLGQLFKNFENQAQEKLQKVQDKSNSEEGMKARAEQAAQKMKAHFSATHKERPESRYRKEAK